MTNGPPRPAKPTQPYSILDVVPLTQTFGRVAGCGERGDMAEMSRDDDQVAAKEDPAEE